MREPWADVYLLVSLWQNLFASKTNTLKHLYWTCNLSVPCALESLCLRGESLEENSGLKHLFLHTLATKELLYGPDNNFSLVAICGSDMWQQNVDSDSNYLSLCICYLIHKPIKTYKPEHFRGHVDYIIWASVSNKRTLLGQDIDNWIRYFMQMHPALFDAVDHKMYTMWRVGLFEVLMICHSPFIILVFTTHPDMYRMAANSGHI